MQIMKITGFHNSLSDFYRETLYPTGSLCHTTIQQRTGGTIGRLRGTLQSPEIHDRLIIQIRTSTIQQQLCQFRELSFTGRTVDRCIDGKQAGQYPIDISVDNRIRQTPGKRTDSCRRIFTNSFQPQYFRISMGKFSSIFQYNLLGRSMQMTCPTVISQPLPVSHHLIFTRCRQKRDFRETLHKTVEIFQSLHDPGLLQNNFRNPDPVRILCFPPWQFPLILCIPANQQLCDFRMHTRLIHESAVLPPPRRISPNRQEQS